LFQFQSAIQGAIQPPSLTNDTSIRLSLNRVEHYPPEPSTILCVRLHPLQSASDTSQDTPALIVSRKLSPQLPADRHHIFMSFHCAESTADLSWTFPEQTASYHATRWFITVVTKSPTVALCRPKDSVEARGRPYVTFHNLLLFTVRNCQPSPNPLAGGPPLTVTGRDDYTSDLDW
jgi:hypothetical protein